MVACVIVILMRERGGDGGGVGVGGSYPWNFSGGRQSEVTLNKYVRKCVISI